MSTLLQADIFFFIASVATIVVAAVFVILLIYLIKIFKNFKSVSQIIKSQTEIISKDLNAARNEIKNETWKIKSIWDLFLKSFSPNSNKKRKTKTKEKP
jgi:uncharacterized protein YoxC